MKIVYNNYIPFKGYRAMNMLGIWLFVRRVKREGQWSDPLLSETTIRHEEIHSAQYKEMMYIGFLIWYGIEWVVRLVCEFALWAVKAENSVKFGEIAHAAYKNISLEQEAYAIEKNIQPIEKIRKRYGWIKYLKTRSYKG